MNVYNAKPLPKDATHLWNNYRQGYYVDTRDAWYVVWQTDDADVATVVSQCFGKQYDYDRERDLTLIETLEHCKNLRHEFSNELELPLSLVIDERFLILNAEHYAARSIRAISEMAREKTSRTEIELLGKVQDELNSYGEYYKEERGNA